MVEPEFGVKKHESMDQSCFVSVVQDGDVNSVGAGMLSWHMLLPLVASSII